MQMRNAKRNLRNAGGLGGSISQNSLRVLPDFLAGFWRAGIHIKNLYCFTDSRYAFIKLGVSSRLLSLLLQPYHRLSKPLLIGFPLPFLSIEAYSSRRFNVAPGITVADSLYGPNS